MGGDEPFHDTAQEGDPSARRNELTEQHDEWITDLQTGTFRTTFDSRTESAGMAVVSAVAAVSNTESRKMDPLNRILDMDALDGIFHLGSDGQVTFPYHGCEVVVRSDGVITVTPDGRG